MLLACYNWKLEKAFLADIEVVLPEPGMTWDEDDDDNNSIDKMFVDEVKKVSDEGNKDVDEKDKDSVLATEAVDADVGKDGDAKKDLSSFDDPLTSTFVRKGDSDRLSCGVPIRDFSDPLRATMSVEDEVFLPTEESLKADSHTDR